LKNLESRTELAMSEITGITELQLLEAEILLLNKQLDGVKKAETTSASCARVLASIQAAEEKDGFVGGSLENNQYHSSSGSGAEGGCCNLM